MFWWRQQIDTDLEAGFTDASAGNLALHVRDDPAAVARNRSRLEAGMAVAPGSLQFMSQVHSADVAVATGGPAPTADALVSLDGSVPLAVMVADCVPVLLAGTASGSGIITAAAHAGRRGLLDGILPAVVDRMRAAGAQSLRAWIGPSICGRCYEVPVRMQAESVALLPAVRSQTSWGTPALDLPAGAARQLEDLGVQVHRVGACTLENEELFSHRRDPDTGRFAGVIWRTGENMGERTGEQPGPADPGGIDNRRNR